MRYLVTLCIGLIIIGVLSNFWLKHSITEKRLDIMKLIAEEISDKIIYAESKTHAKFFIPDLMEKRQKFLKLEEKPVILILNENKNIVFSSHSKLPYEFFQNISFDDKKVKKFKINQKETFFYVKQKIVSNEKNLGWVLIYLPEKDLTRNKEQLQLLIIMLVSLALLGWATIYFLTRKLAKPIKDVANASKQIREGSYNVSLDEDIKEKEVYELVQSFKDMSERLKQLEMMRTELLAGVTHELKTPVTSISGLVQAVKNGVVSGDEAKEFLEICTKETDKLQKMVEDLLEFNAFAVADVKVNYEKINLNHLIKEITHQWLITQENSSFDFNLHLPDKIIEINTDPLRIQQILYNLLKNAKEVVSDEGKIDVYLYEENEVIKVDVKDNGKGIPKEEQNLIFERFYRGKDKKNKVRGLGLGLSFSKMIAKALGGDLVLKESLKSGTIFTLILR
jgi:signal transduction histidine kinase